ncbi:hypothetical protein OIU78_021378 [Salix suchowensis]|nr:hypothetical protein OIU78_021378 [Salix suchowensis]
MAQFINAHLTKSHFLQLYFPQQPTVPRRNAMALILSSYLFSELGFDNLALAQQSVGFREYIDQFDGYSFKYPKSWIQVRGTRVLKTWALHKKLERRVADDGKLYYQVEVNIKSYANNNELAVMPRERVVRLEWDRRYLSVLGVENNQLYELRLQTPENVFVEEENDLREVMDSFRVNKIAV